MKKLVIPGVLLLGTIAVLATTLGRGDQETAYRFAEVTRGDVRTVVTSTGTLQAITTIEVGTQVSGKVSEIYVDFNDRVTKGQLIARIDPVLLEQAVRTSEASLARNQAELAQAQREFDRVARLHERKAATDSEYDSAQYRLDVAQASLVSAKIDVERAHQNLDYSEIRAPVDGVVLDRAVDEGQTVAASLSAPLLFLIAEDLSKMEILAAVDESDIGKVEAGQSVEFAVQAYPDSTFVGEVHQVRLNSTAQENVVNYIVSIAVENPSGRLLPGMTATVDFIVAESLDVLRIPNAALRFRPTEEMLTAMRKRRESASGGSGGAVDGAPASDSESSGRGSSRGGSRRAGGDAANRAMLWTLEEGEPVAIFARTGIADGQYTEVMGPDVSEGLQVIAAIVKASAAAAANPFQSDSPGQRRGPPGL
ncbi:MAG: RND transporter [Gemmatimonadota bacterium]|nr:MAG: RND transporter [Gemmatimonadota bacterium]